jgi:predicted nucleic acid-binding protein
VIVPIEFLDANLPVRYLTDDPPELAARAAALIESDTALTISFLTLAEVAYVLTKVYGRERGQVVEALIALIQRENLSVYHVDTDLAVEALELCRPSGRVDFADALLWAEARTAGGIVHTFDARFPEEGITVRHP